MRGVFNLKESGGDRDLGENNFGIEFVIEAVPSEICTI